MKEERNKQKSTQICTHFLSSYLLTHYKVLITLPLSWHEQPQYVVLEASVIISSEMSLQ